MPPNPLSALLGIRTPGWRPPDLTPARATHPPLPIVPDSAITFGPGLGYQPEQDDLLRLNRGTPKTATRAIANRIGSLSPLVQIPRRIDARTIEYETLDDHRLKHLLEYPHPDFSQGQLFALLAEWFVTLGDAYLLKGGDLMGLPARLTPLDPRRMRPLVDMDQVAAFEFYDGNGARQIIERDAVIRIYRPDPANVFGGEGILGPNGTETDAARYQHEHLRAYYERNATPATVIESLPESPMPTKEEQERFYTQWVAAYNQRLGRKRGTPALLPPGAKIVQLAMQTGQDITPLLEYYDRQQLQAFGVPSSILGRVESGDRSSAETNQYVFDTHTVLPIATVFEDALTRQLAHDFDKSLVVRFDDWVIRDKGFELKQRESDLATKRLTINETRRDAGLDDVAWGDLPAGTIGDEPYTGEKRAQLQFSPSDSDPDAFDDEGPIDDDPEQGTDDDPAEVRMRLADRTVFYERLYGGEFQFRMQRIFRAQRARAVSRLRDSEPRARMPIDDLFKVEEWLSLFALELAPVYRKIAEAAGRETIANVVGSDVIPFVFTSKVQQYVQEEGARLVTRTGETTKRRITEALSEGVEAGESERKLVQRLNAVFDRRKRDTRVIARTEVGKAVSAATIEGARQSGVVTHKRWLHSGRLGDPRHGHLDLDRQTLELNELFTITGQDGNVYRAVGPRAPNLPAGEVINCQCDLAFPRIKTASE